MDVQCISVCSICGTISYENNEYCTDKGLFIKTDIPVDEYDMKIGNVCMLTKSFEKVLYYREYIFRKYASKLNVFNEEIALYDDIDETTTLSHLYKEYFGDDYINNSDYKKFKNSHIDKSMFNNAYFGLSEDFDFNSNNDDK